MKKVFTVVLAMVMVLTMGVSAFAATDSFFKSPSVNPAPDLEKVDNPNDGCTAEIIITPYSERDELDDESQKDIEDAYDTIKNNEDGSSLDEALEELADDDHPVDALAISDLFDIDYTNCDIHDEHDPVTITITAETANNFVGLLVYVNGEWKIVDGTTVNKEETTLTFKAAEFGPYAIVVDTEGSPSTGDPGIPWFWFVLLGVSGAGLIAVAIVSKKRAEK